jgi:putative ABC transport system ATP-binding protein
LLSILGCILTPSSGRLVVCDRPIGKSDLVAIRKSCIGFVFQQYNLVPALTALENVELALRIRGIKGPRLAADALAAVGLHDRMQFLPRDLSGGQKQRVAIARAIAGSTPVLLADEPTANLDSRSGEQVLSLFRALAVERGRALLVVTHDPQVRKIADRVLFIRDGALLA